MVTQANPLQHVLMSVLEGGIHIDMGKQSGERYAIYPLCEHSKSRPNVYLTRSGVRKRLSLHGG